MDRLLQAATLPPPLTAAWAHGDLTLTGCQHSPRTVIAVAGRLLAVEHDGDELLLRDLAVAVHIELVDHCLSACQLRPETMKQHCRNTLTTPRRPSARRAPSRRAAGSSVRCALSYHRRTARKRAAAPPSGPLLGSSPSLVLAWTKCHGAIMCRAESAVFPALAL